MSKHGTTSAERNADPIEGPDAVPAPPASAARHHGDIAAMLTRNIFTHGIAVVRQFIILPLLSPAQLGLFRFVQQLAAYSRYFTVGALSTFQVRYPEWQAAGHHERCRGLQSLALYQTIVGALVFAPVFLGLVWHVDIPPRFLVPLAAVAAFTLLSDYVASTYTVRGEFRTMAAVDLAVSIGSVFFLLGGLYLFGLPGVLIGGLMAPSLRVLIGWRYFTLFSGWPGWRQAYDHVRFGTGVWIANTLTGLAVTLDIILLGLFYGDTADLLGLYAVGVMLAQILAQDLRAVTLVQQRALRVEFGAERTATSEDLTSLIGRYLGSDSFLGVIFGAVVLAAAWLLFPTIFPQYAESLESLGPLLASVIVVKPRAYTRVVLEQSDRVRGIIVTSLVQTIVLVASFLLIYQLAAGAFAFAVARLLSCGVGTVMELVLAHSTLGRVRRGWQLAGKMLVSNVPLVLGFVILPELMGSAAWAVVGAVGAIAASYPLYQRLLGGSAREAIDLLRAVVRRRLRQIKKSPSDA